jgi:transposase
LFILLAPYLFIAPVLGQTQPPPPGADTGIDQGAQDLSPGASQTQNTVPQNPYMNPTSLIQQTAEQNKDTVIQNTVPLLSDQSELGAYNETYMGLKNFWGDDIVSNFFANIGQLIGRWITELINGWVSDTVQFLTAFLRTFVLNPNIAVNGLNNGIGGGGNQNDDISPYIRQGADTMYGIAVDLLLLLFILCIWKYWADAAWRGGVGLMGSVGRLIFTAGLMLAWPTIYAFEIQITNEMIKAIYFNSADQVVMLDAAMAAAVKGGLLAAGGLLANAFAPLVASLAGGALAGGAGGMALGLVGDVVAFAGLVIYLVLGGILIAELIYMLVLKAIQTALLTAQYMFAPIFLVFFATPDTESVCSGFVRSFVEVSLWTFVWVGLLKIMVIILFSDFNPWGKIVMAVGVLQLMIQVPSFLSRAQISPMSDFISAGLLTGGLMKGVSALGAAAKFRAGQAIDYMTNQRWAARGLPQSQGVTLNRLPQSAADQNLMNNLKGAGSAGGGGGPVAKKDDPSKKPPGDPTQQGKQINTQQDPKQKDKDKDKNKLGEKPPEKQLNTQDKDKDKDKKKVPGDPTGTSTSQLKTPGGDQKKPGDPLGTNPTAGQQQNLTGAQGGKQGQSGVGSTDPATRMGQGLKSGLAIGGLAAGAAAVGAMAGRSQEDKDEELRKQKAGREQAEAMALAAKAEENKLKGISGDAAGAQGKDGKGKDGKEKSNVVPTPPDAKAKKTDGTGAPTTGSKQGLGGTDADKGRQLNLPGVEVKAKAPPTDPTKKGLTTGSGSEVPPTGVKPVDPNATGKGVDPTKGVGDATSQQGRQLAAINEDHKEEHEKEGKDDEQKQKGEGGVTSARQPVTLKVGPASKTDAQQKGVTPPAQVGDVKSSTEKAGDGRTGQVTGATGSEVKGGVKIPTSGQNPALKTGGAPLAAVDKGDKGNNLDTKGLTAQGTGGDGKTQSLQTGTGQGGEAEVPHEQKDQMLHTVDAQGRPVNIRLTGRQLGTTQTTAGKTEAGVGNVVPPANPNMQHQQGGVQGGQNANPDLKGVKPVTPGSGDALKTDALKTGTPTDAKNLQGGTNATTAHGVQSQQTGHGGDAEMSHDQHNQVLTTVDSQGRPVNIRLTGRQTGMTQSTTGKAVDGQAGNVTPVPPVNPNMQGHTNQPVQPAAGGIKTPVTDPSKAGTVTPGQTVTGPTATADQKNLQNSGVAQTQSHGIQSQTGHGGDAEMSQDQQHQVLTTVDAFGRPVNIRIAGRQGQVSNQVTGKGGDLAGQVTGNTPVPPPHVQGTAQLGQGVVKLPNLNQTNPAMAGQVHQNMGGTPVVGADGKGVVSHGTGHDRGATGGLPVSDIEMQQDHEHNVMQTTDAQGRPVNIRLTGRQMGGTQQQRAGQPINAQVGNVTPPPAMQTAQTMQQGPAARIEGIKAPAAAVHHAPGMTGPAAYMFGQAMNSASVANGRNPDPLTSPIPAELQDGGGFGGDDGSGGGGGGGGGGGPQPARVSPFDKFKQAYYRWVPPRSLAIDIRTAQGPTMGPSPDGKPTVVGDGKGHVNHVRFGAGATDEQKALQMLAAGYATTFSSDSEAFDAARQSAIDAGEDGPQNMGERMAAGFLAHEGKSFKQTATAKQRFQRSLFKHAVLGSEAYVNGQEGNQFTEYLRTRYGDMTPDQQAWGIHIMTDDSSPESGWSPKVGPATETLLSTGIPITAGYRAAAANTAVLKQPAWGRGPAIRGVAAYVESIVDRQTGADTHPMVKDAMVGRIAPSVSAAEVGACLAIMLESPTAEKGEEICKNNPAMVQSVAQLVAGGHQSDYVSAYRSLSGMVDKISHRGTTTTATQQVNMVGGGGGFQGGGGGSFTPPTPSMPSGGMGGAVMNEVLVDGQMQNVGGNPVAPGAMRMAPTTMQQQQQVRVNMNGITGGNAGGQTVRANVDMPIVATPGQQDIRMNNMGGSGSTPVQQVQMDVNGRIVGGGNGLNLPNLPNLPGQQVQRRVDVTVNPTTGSIQPTRHTVDMPVQGTQGGQDVSINTSGQGGQNIQHTHVDVNARVTGSVGSTGNLVPPNVVQGQQVRQEVDINIVTGGNGMLQDSRQSIDAPVSAQVGAVDVSVNGGGAGENGGTVQSVVDVTERSSGGNVQGGLNHGQIASIGETEAQKMVRQTHLAQQIIMEMHSAGFRDDQIQDPRIAQAALDVYQNDASMMTTAAVTARVMGPQDMSLQSVQTVQAMIDAGWGSNQISRPDVITAQAIMETGGGYPTPRYVQEVRMDQRFYPKPGAVVPQDIASERARKRSLGQIDGFLPNSFGNASGRY